MASTSPIAAAAGQKTCTASGAGRLRLREPWTKQPAAAVAQGGLDQLVIFMRHSLGRVVATAAVVAHVLHSLITTLRDRYCPGD